MGIVSETIDVSNINIHVDWNGAPLYDEDHDEENKYDSDFTYQLGWDVPSFAPSGDYFITVTGTGTTESGENGTVLCVNAAMTL